MSQSELKVGVVGGTGYTGVELLRLLAAHPAAKLVAITSRGEAGRRVDELFPSLRGYCDLSFVAPNEAALSDCDLVFFATPNGIAMQQVPELLAAGVRVIDLAADFRLRDAGVWKQWYGQEHSCPELLDEAVYGLPEMHRDAIKSARLVANPGCYPTAVTLGLLPLMEAGLVQTGSLIADCKSGVSGAGRKADLSIAYGEVNESFKAYGVSGHRHRPEIEQNLAELAAAPQPLVFVPHLTPMIRGIHATLYAGVENVTDLQSRYEQRYADEPFVDVMPAGSHPETRSVRGGNHCRIALHCLPEDGRVVVLSVIDNLVKGAAGQALQNMNLMFGLPETTGLQAAALLP